jgi:hypothetical protein
MPTQGFVLTKVAQLNSKVRVQPLPAHAMVHNLIQLRAGQLFKGQHVSHYQKLIFGLMATQ